ncbi:polyprenyl synthetase family protein [Bacteroidota bacterium]
MSDIKKIQAPIKEEMKKFSSMFRSYTKSKIYLLNIITRYIVKTKGKQMRPMFVFLSAKLFGAINQSSYHAATLIELMHSATLIHDDVVDEAYERRGFFSINALWKNKIAVLIGDHLLAKGLLLAVKNEEYNLLSIISETVEEMSEGELLQIEKTRKLNITEADYFEIIRKKTATLIAACTSAGASSNGASTEMIIKMKTFGEFVGISFQIRDDIFDYQNNNKTGKPARNDIKEKKMTLPLIHVLNKVSASEKKKILRVIKKQRQNNIKVEGIVDYVNKHGGIKYATEKMIEYRDKALDILDDFEQSPVRESLKELVKFSASRNK